MSDHLTGAANLAGWPEYPIREVCVLVSRGTAPVYVDHSPVKVIGQRCVQDSGFDAAAARFHDARAGQALRARSGDVLLNSTGTGTIGRSCIFQEGGDYIVDGHVTVLRTAAPRLDPRWLNALLLSPPGQRHLESYCYTGSTSQVELSRSELLDTKIPVPPLPEQRRIMEIIESVDDQIDSAARIASKIRAQVSGALDRYMGEDGRHGPVTSVGDVLVRIDSGWSPLCDEDPPPRGAWGVIKVSAVTSGRYLPAESKALLPGMRGRPDIEIHDGDLIMCRANGARHLVGAAVMVAGTPPKLMLSDKTLRLVPNSALMSSGYLFYFMKSSYARRQVEALLSGSSGQSNISQRLIRSMRIPLPGHDRQRQVADAINALDAQIRAEAQALGMLHSLKQGLMGDLLTGRVSAYGRSRSVVSLARRPVRSVTEQKRSG